MRKSRTSNGLKIQVVAGTYVVVLGFNLPEGVCTGLMGFSIHRTDHTENEAYYLEGIKTFSETDPGLVSGSLHSTKFHPIQSFQWADYSAKPGHHYTYRVSALKGTPKNLMAFAATSVSITTESIETGDHDIYFNRGLAASQEYMRRYGDKRPDQVINNKAFEWLSRGLYEALEFFVTDCIAGKHSLRVAAYEFNYEPFLQLIKATWTRGVDIKIVFDERSDIPGKGNREKITACGLADICTPRKAGKSYVAHNKFMVKLEDDIPVSVWTGGTNFSRGGIFGHSNVAHVVEDTDVAKSFFKYWQELQADPETQDLRRQTELLSPQPGIPVPMGTSVIFSPRSDLAALKFYQELAMSAKEGLFMTFAFGINPVFREVFKTSTAPFRLALLEKKTRPMKPGPLRDEEERQIQALRNMPQNVFAIGNLIATNEFDGWVKETLSGLNSNVKYVHNKFMLIDPMSNDPIVVAGSANFSNASTFENDENMLVVRGNTRVADIYLGEFMRLFSHHSFRESLQWQNPEQQPKPLRTDDWWTDHFGTTPRASRRKFFARVDD